MDGFSFTPKLPSACAMMPVSKTLQVAVIGSTVIQTCVMVSLVWAALNRLGYGL
jgi:hypothetical protein